VLVSLTELDHIEHEGQPFTSFACALREAGIECVEAREATAADVGELRTSWAKRLGIPARRPAQLLTARRSAAERPEDLLYLAEREDQ
jgi:hypothetical protein